jgi:glutathione S-transferase
VIAARERRVGRPDIAFLVPDFVGVCCAKPCEF